MSIIINALRKSEQEHQQSKQVQPIENSIFEPNETINSGSNWPVIIAALVIVSVIALAYFFGFNTPEQANINEPQTAANKSQLKPAKPAPIKQQKTIAKLVKPSPKITSNSTQSKPPMPTKAAKKQAKPEPVTAKVNKPAIVAKNKTNPLPKQTKPAAKKITQKTEIQKPLTPTSTSKTTKTESPAQPLTSQAKVNAKPLAIKTPKVIQNVTQPKTAIASNKPATVVKTPAKTATPPQTQVNAKKAEQEYPLLKKLPYEFRRNVPKLNINIFVYNEDPKQCFVIVDMFKYQTGQVLPGNIKLKEIRQDSLVVDYKNKVFRIKRP